MKKPKTKGTLKLEFRLQKQDSICWTCWRTVSRGPCGNMRFNTYNLNPRVSNFAQIEKAKLEIREACEAQGVIVQFRVTEADYVRSSLRWLERDGKKLTGSFIHA